MERTKCFFASFAFSVITVEAIMIQTCSAPQNDCLNFSFVKDTFVDVQKLARNGQKTSIYLSASFPPHYRRVLISHVFVFNLWFKRVFKKCLNLTLFTVKNYLNFVLIVLVFGFFILKFCFEKFWRMFFVIGIQDNFFLKHFAFPNDTIFLTTCLKVSESQKKKNSAPL